nr:lysM domain receptor-like kinase 4 [Ipomoea batatas]
MAGLGFPLANRELRKLVRRAPGKIGCFIFFIFAYIFTAVDLDSINFSCFVFEDFSAVVLTGLGREELKQEVLSDNGPGNDEESAPELESEELELKNKGSLSKSDSNDDSGDQSSPPPQVVSKSSSKTWKYVVVGVLGGLGCLGIVGWVVFLLCIRKREKKGEAEMVTKSFEAVEKQLKKKLDEEVGLSYGSVSDLVESVKMYTFEEIKSATENFNPSCGTINGDFATIKKMNIFCTNQENEYILHQLRGIRRRTRKKTKKPFDFTVNRPHN